MTGHVIVKFCGWINSTRVELIERTAFENGGRRVVIVRVAGAMTVVEMAEPPIVQRLFEVPGSTVANSSALMSQNSSAAMAY